MTCHLCRGRPSSSPRTYLGVQVDITPSRPLTDSAWWPSTPTCTTRPTSRPRARRTPLTSSSGCEPSCRLLRVPVKRWVSSELCNRTQWVSHELRHTPVSGRRWSTLLSSQRQPVKSQLVQCVSCDCRGETSPRISFPRMPNSRI